MNKTFVYVIKRIWLILLCGTIISFGLMAEKYFYGNYIIRSGDIFLSRIVRLEKDINNNIDNHDIFHFEKYMSTYPVIHDFQKEYSKKYNFSYFDADWKNKGNIKRYEWQQNHIFINKIGNNIYEVCFRLKNNDLKNMIMSSIIVIVS